MFAIRRTQTISERDRARRRGKVRRERGAVADLDCNSAKNHTGCKGCCACWGQADKVLHVATATATTRTASAKCTCAAAGLCRSVHQALFSIPAAHCVTVGLQIKAQHLPQRCVMQLKYFGRNNNSSSSCVCACVWLWWAWRCWQFWSFHSLGFVCLLLIKLNVLTCWTFKACICLPALLACCCCGCFCCWSCLLRAVFGLFKLFWI